ncbi:hypothetical protein K435DRAFT_187804 [Dendrothele bispora CBS 962.96]|uniref:Uncharacterized protein n=1 Tax=Dendrothele bispora (strain CBS 962.96) TaxID=1314807 RepID=A0A4S8LVJ3_DENBC|nr:hypothetical protein K435DRAFT_187804 [Dendrothele bispora CBS 962.96]
MLILHYPLLSYFILAYCQSRCITYLYLFIFLASRFPFRVALLFLYLLVSLFCFIYLTATQRSQLQCPISISISPLCSSPLFAVYIKSFSLLALSFFFLHVLFSLIIAPCVWFWFFSWLWFWLDLSSPRTYCIHIWLIHPLACLYLSPSSPPLFRNARSFLSIVSLLSDVPHLVPLYTLLIYTSLVGSSLLIRDLLFPTADTNSNVDPLLFPGHATHTTLISYLFAWILILFDF